MATSIPSHPTRLQQLKTAFHEAQARESAKPLTQKIKEQVATPYYLAKGVGRWALKLLEAGKSLQPENMIPRLVFETAVTIVDVQNLMEGKDSQIARDFKKGVDKISHPQRELKQLWEGSLDRITQSTKKFIQMPYPEQAEAIGELAPDVVAWLGVVGELKAAATAGKVIEGTKTIQVGVELVKAAENRTVLNFANKVAAKTAFEGGLGAAAKRFFQNATSKSIDFKAIELENGTYRFEFFSPANNPGYGKKYIQEVDAAGNKLKHLKETLGPDGLIETKWLKKGPL